MQRVTDQVDAHYLHQPTPRPLPYVVILNVLGDYTFERPTNLLDPLLIVGFVTLTTGMLLQMRPALLLIPLALVLARFAVGAYRVGRRAWDDVALLRKGVLVQAHVLKVRAHRTVEGTISGALLDCAIPIAPRRTYIGSVWMADGEEARRLARRECVEVLCLPRSPGTWRVVEEIRSEARYDRVGAIAVIPEA